MSVPKITTVGESVGEILPREILETGNGIEPTGNNPDSAKQVETAERVMREDRDALLELAR